MELTAGIYEWNKLLESMSRTILLESMNGVNPIPAGGVKLTPPPVVFLHNSKSIGLRLLKFSDFS